MPYQYKREPLNDNEVNKLIDACEEFDERFVIFTLLDTVRVSELAKLTKKNIQRQERQLIIYGKGGPYGKKTKERKGTGDRFIFVPNIFMVCIWPN